MSDKNITLPKDYIELHIRHEITLFNTNYIKMVTAPQGIAENAVLLCGDDGINNYYTVDEDIFTVTKKISDAKKRNNVL